MLIIHIILALASLALSTYNFFRPQSSKLQLSYGLATGTLASGILLIIMYNASILRTCLSGVLFYGVVALLNELARKKLSPEISE